MKPTLIYEWADGKTWQLYQSIEFVGDLDDKDLGKWRLTLTFKAEDYEFSKSLVFWSAQEAEDEKNLELLRQNIMLTISSHYRNRDK